MNTPRQRNWLRALTEVIASVIGTVGIILLISLILSLQAEAPNLQRTFSEYFSGGQIGLPILSLSGIIFIAITRHERLHPFISVALFLFFLCPIIATAFIIGLNPGFQAATLASANLTLLWVFFVGLHILWFIILLLEPTLPSVQEVGDAQENRVSKIIAGATGRA